jgi:hypothetical protein
MLIGATGALSNSRQTLVPGSLITTDWVGAPLAVAAVGTIGVRSLDVEERFAKEPASGSWIAPAGRPLVPDTSSPGVARGLASLTLFHPQHRCHWSAPTLASHHSSLPKGSTATPYRREFSRNTARSYLARSQTLIIWPDLGMARARKLRNSMSITSSESSKTGIRNSRLSMVAASLGFRVEKHA